MDQWLERSDWLQALGLNEAQLQVRPLYFGFVVDPKFIADLRAMCRQSPLTLRKRRFR